MSKKFWNLITQRILAIPLVLSFTFFTASLMTTSLWAEENSSRFIEFEKCQKTNSPILVHIVKQWHLSPATNTFANPTQELPQTPNQKSIFTELSNWIDKKELKTVIAEGCEEELTDKFPKVYNGWSMLELKKRVADTNYADLTANVPMKLEAKYGASLQTHCGDDEKLVKDGALALSNLRGLSGYYSRIKQYSGSSQAKAYLDGAIELLKLPKSTDEKSVLSALKDGILKEVQAFENSIQARNSTFVKTVEKIGSKNSAIVIGGLHTSNLKSQIEAKGWNCLVHEPQGYNSQMDHTLEEFKKLIE